MAFTVAEEIEFCAQIYYQTKSVGEPKLLPEDEMENLAKKFEGYGKGNETKTPLKKRGCL